MNNQPLVSVIIPTYQRWDLLCDAIDSVIRQTFTDWEIVVVNDCGGPPQGRAVELLRNPKVKYLEHTVNKGLASARNTGIINSSGIFIAYLDDDDFFYPNHIELLVGVLLENNWEVAYTDANEGVYRLNGAKYCLVEKNVVFGGEFSPAMMWQANTIPVLSVLHRRTCLEKTGYFDEDLPVLEDWDLWLRFTFHYQFHYISAVTAEYTVRRDNTNMSQNTSDDKWMKIKCLIYRKYHNDIQVIADKNFRKLLIETVSWFFVTRMEWFSRMLSETETDPNVIAMLRFITLKTWVRIFKIKQYRRLALLITKKLIIKTFTLS